MNFAADFLFQGGVLALQTFDLGIHRHVTCLLVQELGRIETFTIEC
jgi:hypothetical protein